MDKNYSEDSIDLTGLNETANTPQKKKRVKRDVWDSSPLIRKRSRIGKNNKPFVTRLPNKRACAVCCAICCTKSKHSDFTNSKKFRFGYRIKTACSCSMCLKNNNKNPLPLCTKPRFDMFEGLEYTPYKGMSCFDIHHSGMKYPVLQCSLLENNENEDPNDSNSI